MKHRTELEEVYGRNFSSTEWEAVGTLEQLARKLADHCALVINAEAGKVSREPLRYNEQWTLEKLITYLQAKV